jgi:hypothetical protein
MTSADARRLLGPPEREQSQYDLLAPYSDPEVLGEAYLELLRRLRTMTFADSATNNRRPTLIFLDEKLAEIHLEQKDDSLVVRGLDLWQRDRVALVTGLARGEEVMLFSGISPDRGFHLMHEP